MLLNRYKTMFFNDALGDLVSYRIFKENDIFKSVLVNNLELRVQTLPS